MVLDKIETIKLKGKVISLRTATQKDGKEYVELENCIRAFFNPKTDEEYKELISIFPKSYIKGLAINDTKVKFIDRMALGMLLNKHRNYEFFQWYIGRHVSTLDNYAIEVFKESTKYIVTKANSVKELKTKIKHYDDIQQDMLHDIENHIQSEEDKIDFVNQVVVMRQERRKLKNELAFSEVLNDFLKEGDLSNRKVDAMTKEISRLEHIFDKRVYNEKATTTEHMEIKNEIIQKVIESQQALKNLPIVEIEKEKVVPPMEHKPKLEQITQKVEEPKGLTQKQKQKKITKMLKKAGIR